MCPYIYLIWTKKNTIYPGGLFKPVSLEGYRTFTRDIKYNMYLPIIYEYILHNIEYYTVHIFVFVRLWYYTIYGLFCTCS